MSPVPSGSPSDPPTLKRSLGLLQVAASGVGIIIGAGIYVLLGTATRTVGPAVWLSFVFAGVLSALTAFSYAELASMFPKSSGEFEYTRQVAGPAVSFVVGWMMIIGMLVAAAAVALGFASYIGHFTDVPTKTVAMGLLTVEALFACVGVAHSAKMTVLLSGVQVLGLLLIIGIGVPHLGDVDLLQGAARGPVLGGAALVFFAFIGFDEVITLAEETKDPTRVVPRALLTALAISTVLYVAVAVAAVSVLGSGPLGASPRPLADVMSHVLGQGASDVVAAIAALSTVNTSLLAITAGSRLIYGMAQARALPVWLAGVNRSSRAPVRAIVLAAIVAIGFVTLGDLELVASVTDFAIYIVFIAVNVAVIVLRYRKPDAPRPFRSPWSLGRLPVLPLLGLGSVAMMLPHLKRDSVVIGVGVGIVGAVVGRLLHRPGLHPGPT